MVLREFIHYKCYLIDQGPKKLGDPHYRRLSNMEKDPMISSRMRDIARTDLCQDAVKRFTACTQREVSLKERAWPDIFTIDKWVPIEPNQLYQPTLPIHLLMEQ